MIAPATSKLDAENIRDLLPAVVEGLRAARAAADGECDPALLVFALEGLASELASVQEIAVRLAERLANAATEVAHG